MNPVVIYFCSGLAFFAGMALCLCSLVLSPPAGECGQRRHLAWRISYLAGFILVVLSATPMHPLGYAVFILLSVARIVSIEFPPGKYAKAKSGIRISAVLVIVLLVAMELPSLMLPKLRSSPARAVMVCGDSLTAGIGIHGEQTWPEMLAARGGHDFSVVAIGGAGVADLIPSAKKIAGRKGTVLLLLGGNDLFGRTKIADFERSLDELLAKLAGDGRELVVFELPLPPFHGAYGRVQRRLAKKYSATLIPKRYLAGVLSGKESTVDGLHLSARGHAKLADLVGRILGPGSPRGEGPAILP